MIKQTTKKGTQKKKISIRTKKVKRNKLLWTFIKFKPSASRFLQHILNKIGNCFDHNKGITVPKGIKPKWKFDAKLY